MNFERFQLKTFPQKVLGVLFLLFILSCLLFPILKAASAQDEPTAEGEVAIIEDPWAPQEFIGQYVMVQPIRETIQQRVGMQTMSVRTGKEAENAKNFVTLSLIAKKRNTRVFLTGTEDRSRPNVYIGKFDEHCTPEGVMLAMLLKGLKVEFDGLKYEPITNIIAGWNFIQVYWRFPFHEDKVMPEIKKAFIKAGYGPPGMKESGKQ